MAPHTPNLAFEGLAFGPKPEAKRAKRRAGLRESPRAIGSTVGTVAYMSPEQARGEDLDARSDLFSVGAVLYEMATGRRAFGGETTAIIYDAILYKRPSAPARVNPEVSPKLEAIIDKLLDKDRSPAN
jgi:serine/threonine protein kinase